MNKFNRLFVISENLTTGHSLSGVSAAINKSPRIADGSDVKEYSLPLSTHILMHQHIGESTYTLLQIQKHLHMRTHATPCVDAGISLN